MAELNFLPNALAERLPETLGDATRGLDARLTRLAAGPLALGATGARSGLYLAESIPLFRLQRFVAGEAAAPPQLPEGAQPAIIEALRDVARRDADNIAAGHYPLSVLSPEGSALGHATRYLRLLVDSVGAATRKREKRPREFAGRAAELADELPDYYRRNFHFQNNGYLSAASADLYEHQVELLFRGVADAMRRQVIPPIKRSLPEPADGRGLRMLELAAGCGSATRFVAQAFPEARITCLDLSHPYLRAARKRLRHHERVDFMHGDAADLDLRDGRFDVVYSVFLFHELPGDERARVFAEARRVLRPGGLNVVVDSLQTGDVPGLDWALEEFPRQFHEPYYRDYARNPIEGLAPESGFEATTTNTAFLSKIVSMRRPLEDTALPA